MASKESIQTFITEVNYIPLSDIEQLLLGAKHALKEESKIWQDRAQIEKSYANSLREWSTKNIQRVETNPQLEHSPVRLGLIMSLRESEVTAELHQQVSDLLSGPEGPACALNKYRTKHFKTKFEMDMSIFHRNDWVLQSFETYIGMYRQTVKECTEAVKAAESARREEVNLRKKVCEVKKKSQELSNTSRAYAHTKYHRKQVNKTGKKLVDLEGGLMTASSMKTNAIAKARSVLNQSKKHLEEGINDIQQWECSRINFVYDQYVIALDHVSLLGKESKIAARRARQSLANIDAEGILDQWRQAKISSFKVAECCSDTNLHESSMGSYHQSSPQNVIPQASSGSHQTARRSSGQFPIRTPIPKEPTDSYIVRRSSDVVLQGSENEPIDAQKSKDEYKDLSLHKDTTFEETETGSKHHQEIKQHVTNMDSPTEGHVRYRPIERSIRRASIQGHVKTPVQLFITDKSKKETNLSNSCNNLDELSFDF